MFGFAPSADGVVLLQQPFSPGFAEISKDIPVMMGSTLNEMMPTFYSEKDLTLEQAKERLAKEYGDNTDKYIELFAKAYPDYTPQDFFRLTRFSGHIPYVLPMQGLKSRALRCMFISWHGKVRVDDSIERFFSWFGHSAGIQYR
jgi:para-nitrobenzyl esterase